VGVIPGLQEFAQFFLVNQMGGMGSPLEKAGLIPLNAKERAEVTAGVRARKVMN